MKSPNQDVTGTEVHRGFKDRCSRPAGWTRTGADLWRQAREAVSDAPDTPFVWTGDIGNDIRTGSDTDGPTTGDSVDHRECPIGPRQAHLPGVRIMTMAPRHEQYRRPGFTLCPHAELAQPNRHQLPPRIPRP